MQHSLDLSNKHVLVVDDNAMMRTMHKKNLVDLGFIEGNLHFAVDGVNALQILDKCLKGGTKPALILCDWDMPNLTGLDLLKKLKTFNATKDIPFVMVTGHDKKEEYVQVLKSGVAAIVLKPFKPEVYFEKIITVMSKEELGL